MMALSCLLLAYSAYVVPMQLSFWITDDLCNPFPTLYSDILVDTYFMVRARGLCALRWPRPMARALRTAPLLSTPTSS